MEDKAETINQKMEVLFGMLSNFTLVKTNEELLKDCQLVWRGLL